MQTIFESNIKAETNPIYMKKVGGGPLFYPRGPPNTEAISSTMANQVNNTQQLFKKMLPAGGPRFKQFPNRASPLAILF